MILTEKEVIDIVSLKVDPVIGVNRNLQDDHKVHIEGKGIKIKHLTAYETLDEFKDRQDDVKEFTKLLSASIIDAQSRWKTAQGTSKYYKFKANSEKLDKEFRELVLSKAWKNLSIEQFIKDFYSKAIYTEFNGFLLVEKGSIIKGDDGLRYEVREGIKRPVSNEYNPVPYIVFKSIDDVHRFKVIGKTVEWICFNYGKEIRNEKEITLYRVIDDRNDYIVEQIDQLVRISEVYPVIKHEIGQCPVINISTINNDLIDDKTRTSPIDDLVPHLDVLLQKYIDHTTTARLHNFPIRYQVGQNCDYRNEHTKCDNGHLYWEFNGVAKDIVCPSCGGAGVKKKTSPSQVIILPAMDSEGKAFNIGDVAGYVTPELENFREQRVDIDWWEQKIKEAATGVRIGGAEADLNKTATGAVINIKPLEDKISEIIDLVEWAETQLTNFMGKSYYKDKYEGCEIIYGRRLNLRDEFAILKEITEAKAAGTSFQHIKTLNEELIYSRYSSSISDLQRNIILIELEPLIGYTFNEVKEA